MLSESIKETGIVKHAGFFNKRNRHLLTQKTGVDVVYYPGDILLLYGVRSHPDPLDS